jgi:hypothetical protein
MFEIYMVDPDHPEQKRFMDHYWDVYHTIS